ncbi:MAG TPA: hypothetical protein VKA49_20670 [Flavitalea sp.]|nr:hypothetical protein [Flavitalea sp.]
MNAEGDSVGAGSAGDALYQLTCWGEYPGLALRGWVLVPTFESFGIKGQVMQMLTENQKDTVLGHLPKTNSGLSSYNRHEYLAQIPGLHTSRQNPGSACHRFSKHHFVFHPTK